MSKKYYTLVTIALASSGVDFFSFESKPKESIYDTKMSVVDEVNHVIGKYASIFANAPLIVGFQTISIDKDGEEYCDSDEVTGVFIDGKLVIELEEPNVEFPEPEYRGFERNDEFGNERILLNGSYIKGNWVEGDLFNNYISADSADKYIGNLNIVEGFDDKLKMPIFEIEGHAIYKVISATVSKNTGVLDVDNKKIFEFTECIVTSLLTGATAKGGIRNIQGCYCFVEYDTKTIIKLCDLKLNNLNIKVVNKFCNLNRVGIDMNNQS